jgi:hypothetical protein
MVKTAEGRFVGLGPTLDKRKAASGALAAVMAAALAACGGGSGTGTTPPPNPAPPPPPIFAPPLDEPARGAYKGFARGLYPNSSNTMPAAHSNAGVNFARMVQPLDVNGQPSANGKILMMSVGMSNTTQEYCSGNNSGGTNSANCDPNSFMGLAAADASVNTASLGLIDGARGGQTAETWDSPSDANYDRVRNDILTPRGLSEQQIQVAWVKVANQQPTVALPDAQADAIRQVTQIGNIVRALKTRYPNLRLVFLSSRIFAGYATTTLNPEPYAFEGGLAVKWVVEAQINQMAAGGVVQDARAGNLNYTTGVAPWIAWGPYLWGDGTNMRSDGLIWIQADFMSDGTHPSLSGVRKVGTLLLNFFKTSPQTKCWFVTGGTCP